MQHNAKVAPRSTNLFHITEAPWLFLCVEKSCGALCIPAVVCVLQRENLPRCKFEIVSNWTARRHSRKKKKNSQKDLLYIKRPRAPCLFRHNFHPPPTPFAQTPWTLKWISFFHQVLKSERVARSFVEGGVTMVTQHFSHAIRYSEAFRKKMHENLHSLQWSLFRSQTRPDWQRAPLCQRCKC